MNIIIFLACLLSPSVAFLTTATLPPPPSTIISASPISTYDPELSKILQAEATRQKSGLELIASENFASSAVRQALSSCMTNKYSEGLPGARYYGGAEFVDQLEALTIQRALEVFRLDSEEWGVNVQPYSGSPANFAVYTALLEPHDRIMGLDLPDGGHLTHGFSTTTKTGEVKKVSATSVYFESHPYNLDPVTNLIDYDKIEELAGKVKPKLIIAGASAYPREWDYKRMREIADSVGAYLMTDMAHVSGLVAADIVNSPFEHSHVVTSTTHKSLRGPRSGMIFARKELMGKVNFAVFPALQGGPHNHQIAALCVALKEAGEPEFKEYAKQIVRNAKTLAQTLVANGQTIVTGGTDNHLFLWDARPLGITGSKLERVLEAASITVNKNSLVGDKSAVTPGGVRIGTPALTSRGMKEADMEVVGAFLIEAGRLGVEIQEQMKGEMKGEGKVTLSAFTARVKGDERVKKLKDEVESFSEAFFMPGDELNV